ncbi:MAG: UDP-4-amino-4,6-dideoxy-N-acetyl-beta-L-altrosamine transaminase [bacterium]|nr:UDP-4-amino-4,6-dideoxy-N-acetyl-beta-L-altrosamine transaminase [bacterium]
MKDIPYGHQSIDREDINAVLQVLKGDWLTQGPHIREFEDALCMNTGAKYAVAVANGTAALHIACLAAGIKKGDQVITSPITFLASANCVWYSGGKPVFADICPDTICINPKEVAKKINKHTRAIIPVHFAGHPCDLKELSTLAKKHGLVLIEDAAHALGASYRDCKIGSGKYSDMTILSFHPVKHITTGEGGAVLTNDPEYYKRLLLFRNHGITKQDYRYKPDGEWYYEMQELGYNYRITDMQAALGVSQLRKLDCFVKKRREIVDKYNKAFNKNGYFAVPYEKDSVLSSYHLYVIRINETYTKLQARIFSELRKNGLGVQLHYIPLYRQPYYRQRDFNASDYPEAEKYYRQAISLPLYPDLTAAQIQQVIKTVLKVFHNITKS